MKVRLANSEFLTEYPGGPRFPAGAVLDVPEGIAEKWYVLGIASKASAKAKTFAQERLERMEQEREETELNARGGVFDAMITRRGTSPAEQREAAEDDAEAEADEMAMFAEQPAEDDDAPAGRKRK
jgi:hypothetical protein